MKFNKMAFKTNGSKSYLIIVGILLVVGISTLTISYNTPSTTSFTSYSEGIFDKNPSAWSGGEIALFVLFILFLLVAGTYGSRLSR